VCECVCVLNKAAATKSVRELRAKQTILIDIQKLQNY